MPQCRISYRTRTDPPRRALITGNHVMRANSARLAAHLCRALNPNDDGPIPVASMTASGVHIDNAPTTESPLHPALRF